MNFQFKDEIVLISGASSGIGQACALQFAKAGAKLILLARRETKLMQLAQKLSQQFGTPTQLLIADVRDNAQIQQQIAQLPAAWQSVDVLVNNAGLALGMDALQEGNIEDWEQMIDTNVKGLLYLTRALIPCMIVRQRGHIINIGSIASHEAYAKGAVYCASKHAVLALTQGLRHDLLGTAVRTTLISPGMVETEFSAVRFKGDDERAAKVYQNMRPLMAEDIADAVLYSATWPSHVNIGEIVLWPKDQASATAVYRREIP